MALTTEASVDGRTLQEFLAITQQELASRMNSDMLVAAAQDKKKQFSEWMSLTHWPHLSDQVAENLCGFLQENVVGIFAGAWSKYAELRKCAKETREDPNSTIDVSLADHEFTYAVAPAVDILLNGEKVASIPFSIEVTCKVSGLVLSLKQGAVYRVRTGKCNCTTQILCAGYSVWDHPLANIDLPGELRLSKPVTLVDQ